MTWGRQRAGNPFTGRASPLPRPGELAAMVRDGLTVDDLATALHANRTTIQRALNDGGFNSVTGQPSGEPVAADDTSDLAAALVSPGPWVDQALCAQVDSEVFFPPKGGSTRQAKAVCARCPVRDECLDYALANNEHYGIWGGASEHDRRRLTRGDNPPDRTRTCPECGQTFDAYRNTRIYCSVPCRQRARDHRRAADGDTAHRRTA